MRQHTKGISPSEIRVNKDRIHDYLQNKTMTEEQRKNWNRKPYQLGSNKWNEGGQHENDHKTNT